MTSGRTQGAFGRLPPNLQGAFWVLCSSVLFTTMAVLAKSVGEHINWAQVGFFRAFVALLITLPFMMRQGAHGFRTGRPLMQGLRGLMAAGALLCGFYAYIHLPLADATALGFAKSLFVVPLAVLFLKEKVGIRRWAATLVGFAGVLIMLRPQGALAPAALIALAGSFQVACTMILVRQIAKIDSPVTMLFYASVFMTVGTAIPAALVWQTPTPQELLLLVAIGATAAAAQSCFIRAYSVGEPTAVAPIEYTQLIFSSLAGVIFFAQAPDRYTLLGALVLIGAVIYIAQREAAKGRKPA